MKKKISISFAFALVLLLALAATACAAALRYGVLDYNIRQAENGAFIEHILDISKTYENEYFTLHVNEAVFDGASLSMTMDIVPAEGAPAVFVKPTITAQAGDTPLTLDIESCTGGDFWSGFWVPQTPEWANGGRFGVDCVIIDDADETCAVAPVGTPVTWTVHFDVVRPEWPVSVSSLSLSGDDGDGENGFSFEDYMSSFRSSYDSRQILLSASHDLAEFDAVLPAPDGMDDVAWMALPNTERFVLSGAFSRIDAFSCSFVTEETGVQMADVQTFDLGEYEAEFESLSVTFARADYKLSVRAKPEHGITFRDEVYQNGIDAYAFAVLSPDCTTSFLASGAGINGADESDPSVSFSGTVSLSGPTDTLTFVLCCDPDAVQRGNSPEHEVMRAQKPLTPQQEAMSFTVTLR